jgi:putative oxidoreductase
MTNPNLGLLFIRIAAGAGMMTHGWAKFQNFESISTQFPALLPIGASGNLALVVFAELFCAALLVIGLFSRLALIPLIITMAVAFFYVHGADPFDKKELAFFYLVTYCGLFFTGMGSYAVQDFFKISAGRFSWLLK